MSLSVVWSPACDFDLLRMHKPVAERVCMAVHAFAKDGSGTVERIGPDAAPGEPFLVRVRARGGYAVAQIVVAEGEIVVYRLYSNEYVRPVTRLL